MVSFSLPLLTFHSYSCNHNSQRTITTIITIESHVYDTLFHIDACYNCRIQTQLLQQPWTVFSNCQSQLHGFGNRQPIVHGFKLQLTYSYMVWLQLVRSSIVIAVTIVCWQFTSSFMTTGFSQFFLTLYYCQFLFLFDYFIFPPEGVYFLGSLDFHCHLEKLARRLDRYASFPLFLWVCQNLFHLLALISYY